MHQNWISNFLKCTSAQKPGEGLLIYPQWPIIFYKALGHPKNKIKSILPTGNILALNIQCFTPPWRSNPEQVHSEPGNSKLQCTGGPALIPATTFMPHPGNINAPVLEGFYKHQHQCILRALGPSSILVVFYCPLLSHRWYTVCGVRSSVNNGTLCAYAHTPLGWSYMGHCQHFFFGYRQHSWTIICGKTWDHKF